MAAAATNAQRILIYLLRRDLRLSDNPVFHELARQHSQSSGANFTHVLPLYVYPAQQIEVSGFIPGTSDKWEPGRSPYPEARSDIAGFWRCGPHRAKWIAECVWDLKTNLQSRGSDLVIRAGLLADVIRDALDHFDDNNRQATGDSDTPAGGKAEIVGVWMTDDECVEERREERAVRRLMEKHGKEFKLVRDDKFYIDDRDQPYQKKQLPNVFTEYRKAVEPLRERPRKTLGTPSKLPPLPAPENIPPQTKPFVIPDTLEEHIAGLVKPLTDFDVKTPPKMPQPWKTQADPVTQNDLSAHPFKGGETAAFSRVQHLLASGAMTNYKETRNGLLGLDFSTKLSAWLALGCISSRQIHAWMVEFEDGSKGHPDSGPPGESDAEREKRFKQWQSAPGFGKGETKGTAAVRFELLWRDYFRLYAQKFGPQLFYLDGVKDNPTKGWKGLDQHKKGNDQQKKSASKEEKRYDKEKVREVLDRFRSGRTGIGLVDASQRELFLTGYTSNRARQNVASFLSKHLQIDWRVGAEWYECMLIDYETANNWGNWQYVAGVGNDPRQDRQFNPVKQALDYDPKGEYIRTWVTELRDVPVEKQDGSIDDTKLIGVFQAWRLPEAEKERLGLKGTELVEDPLKRIDFTLGRRPHHGQDRGKGRRPPRQNRGPRGGRWRGDGQSTASGSSGGTLASRGSSSQRGHSPHA